jgi:hypothetical protein
VGVIVDPVVQKLVLNELDTSASHGRVNCLNPLG